MAPPSFSRASVPSQEVRISSTSRVLPRPATLLLLGSLALAANVGIAWACATWSRAPFPLDDSISPAERWPVDPKHAAHQWPAPEWRYVARGFGLTYTEHHADWQLFAGDPLFDRTATASEETVIGTAVQEVTQCGWPFRSLRMWEGRSAARSEWWDSVPIPLSKSIYSRGIDYSGFDWTVPSPRRLPLEPIPLGFALNTLLYFVILFTVALGAGSARGAWRRGRRRCPRCNYDLSSSPGRCPECGRQSARLGEPGVAAGP